jgi:hypothetical protein
MVVINIGGEAMDKLLHFALSFMLSASLSSFIPREKAKVLTVSVCAGKEIWDYYNPPHCAEWLDLASGIGGVLAADIVVSRIEEKTRKNPNTNCGDSNFWLKTAFE